ncbi:putative reverse transcriptase domain-containing protein [Tanacetum coccineum]
MVNTRQGSDQPNIAAIIAEQLQNIIPQIVTQVTANVNNAQNANVRGRDAANGMSWNDFKALLVEEFCPSNEMEKLELELWNHKMVGGNHAAYTDRFHELARSRAVQPTTIQSAILRECILTDEAISCGTLSKGSEKRKAEDEGAKSLFLLKVSHEFRFAPIRVCEIPYTFLAFHLISVATLFIVRNP